MTVQVQGDEADTQRVPLLVGGPAVLEAPTASADMTVVVPRFSARDLAPSRAWMVVLLAVAIFAAGMLAGAALVWRLALPRSQPAPLVSPLP